MGWEESDLLDSAWMPHRVFMRKSSQDEARSYLDLEVSWAWDDLEHVGELPWCWEEEGEARTA